MRRALRLGWLACALACAAAAHADTYRCQGPDGKTLFTSDRSLCPGASQHETPGQIQRAPGGPPRPPARPRDPHEQPALRAWQEQGAASDGVEAEAWRGKRARAEVDLAETRSRLRTLQQVAGWCNRGHEVWSTDADGLRHDVDCEELAAQREVLEREERRLEAYLAEGLEEECRRAGCLPGWIRE